MRRCFFVLGFAGFLGLGYNEASGPKAKPGNETSEPRFDDSGGKVPLYNLYLMAPKGWARKKPKITLIMAEFALPRAKGDDLDGRLTLIVAGGSIDENIKRWKAQFGGTPQKSHQETFESNGLKITLLDISGEFTDQRGPTAPPVKRPGYRMIGAIIPVHGDLHFIKGVGPEKTMAAHAEKIRTFIRSAKQK